MLKMWAEIYDIVASVRNKWSSCRVVDNTSSTSASTSLYSPSSTLGSDGDSAIDNVTFERDYNVTKIQRTLNSTAATNVSYALNSTVAAAETIDFDLLRKIDYYHHLTFMIWRIWSPVLLGNVNEIISHA